MNTPLLDQDLRLGKRVEHFTGQELVTELPIEAFNSNCCERTT
jgi:hypothetical protein